MPNNVNEVIFASKCKRKVLDGSSQDTLSRLYCKMYSRSADEVTVNSIITKYSSISFKGKTFSISKKNTVPYVVQAQWDEYIFGSSPTSIPDSYLPTTNIRPVDVKYYFNATFTTEATTCSLTFAHVLWLLPHPQRYAIGKPAELWQNGLYECGGLHSFVPIDHLICHCAHGVMQYSNKALMVVVPIVE